MSDLNLTDAERLILANQYEIMSLLHEDKSYLQLSKQLRDGHAWLYRQSFQHLAPVLPDEDAKFVLRILSIYDQLFHSFQKLDDKSGLTEEDVRFPGFDGNDSYESRLLGFAEALAEDRRYPDILSVQRGANSHCQAVPGYKQVIERWRAMGAPRDFNLSKEQIQTLLG
jgi:uncharacterized protein